MNAAPQDLCNELQVDRAPVLAIMQPYFFPYLAYFQLIRSVSVFLPYSLLSYRKSAWVNRNRILTRDRGSVYVTVPLRRKSSFKRIADIELDDSSDWRRRMLDTIRHNYLHRPFFEETYSLVEAVVRGPAGNLGELNVRSLALGAQHLGLPTQILPDAQFLDLERILRDPPGVPSGPLDWIQLDAPDRKVARALAICRAVGASVLVNPIGGEALYRKEDFARNGIALSFLRCRPFSYSQGVAPFHPDLSIIDVLMNCGRAATQRLLCAYDLV
jgi:hypothetical protein